MIYAKWLDHRATLGGLVPIVAQWLDGGFVTAKEETSDADIASLIDGPAYDALDVASREAVDRLLSGPACHAAWLCDSYPIVVYPDNNPLHQIYIAARGYWDDWWTRDNVTNQPKGYLEIR